MNPRSIAYISLCIVPIIQYIAHSFFINSLFTPAFAPPNTLFPGLSRFGFTTSFAVAMKSPNENAQTLATQLQSVLEKHKHGLIDEAIVGYEEIIPLIPNSPTKVSLIGNLGSLLISTGQYDKAQTYFEQAVEISPDDSSAHFNLAVLLTSKKQQHGKAIKHCGLAIKLDPSNYKAYHLMGNILQNLNKLEQAEKYFSIAESLAKDQQVSSTTTTSTSPPPAPNTSSTSTTSENSKEQTDTDQANTDQASTSKGAAETEEDIPKKDSVLSLLFQQLPLNPYTAKVGDTLSITLDKEYILTLHSLRPLVYTIDGLITATECATIRAKASQYLEPSFVMGKQIDPIAASYPKESTETAATTPNSVADSDSEKTEDPSLYRSSYNAWLPVDETLLSIQSKVSQVLHLPIGYIRQKSEDLQVVKYHVGGQFKVHQDSSHFHPRLLTALIYLNDIPSTTVHYHYQGGETWFPFAQLPSTPTTTTTATTHSPSLTSIEDATRIGVEMYETAIQKQKNDDEDGLGGMGGLKVQPKQGRMVIFFNYQDTGILDPYAVHAGLPIRRIPTASSSSTTVRVEEEKKRSTQPIVEKWIANYWISLDKAMLHELL